MACFESQQIACTLGDSQQPSNSQILSTFDIASLKLEDAGEFLTTHSGEEDGIARVRVLAEKN